MNVYDFDKTIYDGDSTIDFWLWCLRRQPALARFAPILVPKAIGLAIGRLTLGDFKSTFMRFVSGIDDVEAAVAQFWTERQSGIKDWYLAASASDDIVISASPDFLLQPICDAIGAELIATRTDPATGRFLSENCKGPEKVRRFREAHPEATVHCFYSDSHSDDPMAALAENARMVKGDYISAWK